MKRVRFIESRTLIDGGLVAAGEEREFDDIEADAFIGNGVAEEVIAKTTVKKAAQEPAEG